MTIYVDQLMKTPSQNPQAFQVGTRHDHQWCHMWTDGNLEELHVFAEHLGLKRSWFQNHKILPHYDIVPTKRTLALKRGAVELSAKEFLEIMRKRREAQRLTKVKRDN